MYLLVLALREMVEKGYWSKLVVDFSKFLQERDELCWKLAHPRHDGGIKAAFPEFFCPWLIIQVD